MVWLACMSLEGASSTALKLCNSMSASVCDTKPRRSMGAFGVEVALSSSACRGGWAGGHQRQVHSTETVAVAIMQHDRVALAASSSLTRKWSAMRETVSSVYKSAQNSSVPVSSSPDSARVSTRSTCAPVLSSCAAHRSACTPAGRCASTWRLIGSMSQHCEHARDCPKNVRLLHAAIQQARHSCIAWP
jgi:hypothetical protein